MGLDQLGAHAARLVQRAAVTFPGSQDLADGRLDLRTQARLARDHPRPGQRQVFPDPGLLGLVFAEGAQRGRDRALPARGAQAHIHLVEPALRGRCGQGADQGLGQAREIGGWR